MESDQRGRWSACFTPILPPESCQLDQCPELPPLFCGAAAVIADFSYLSCSGLRSHSLGQFFSSTASTNSLAQSGAFTSEAPHPAPQRIVLPWGCDAVILSPLKEGLCRLSFLTVSYLRWTAAIWKLENVNSPWWEPICRQFPRRGLDYL